MLTKQTFAEACSSPDPSGQQSQASTEASSSVPIYQGGPFSVAAADVEVYFLTILLMYHILVPFYNIPSVAITTSLLDSCQACKTRSQTRNMTKREARRHKRLQLPLPQHPSSYPHYKHFLRGQRRFTSKSHRRHRLQLLANVALSKGWIKNPEHSNNLVFHHHRQPLDYNISSTHRN
jgi:hypothetical protein